jgi:hypothetical protein
LGSFFAGIKAGTLSGIVYVGGMAAFNVLLLYALQSSVMTAVNRSYPVQCPLIPNVNGSARDCFSALVSYDVPFLAFVAFFITLLYTGIFGIYYDSIRINSTGKGLIIGAVVAVNLVFFGYSGYIFSFESAVASTIFLVGWTAVFGFILARFYRKYTRSVRFESQDSGLLRIVVDGRDQTGKERTFALTSNHRLRAAVGEDASFKEWVPTGGVTLEDSRSFDTTMEVNGEGTITATVGKKY